MGYQSLLNARLLGRFMMVCGTLLFGKVYGQVGISESEITPDATAALEVRSTQRGVLIPRLSTAERNSVPVDTSSKGLLVFDNTLSTFWFYNGSAWVEISDKFTTVGMIMAFPNSSLPDGWLALDGTSIPKTDYADLETVYPGWVSGSNIVLPDYRGYYLRGTGTNASNSLIAGNTLGSAQGFSTRLPRNSNFGSDTTGSHTHTLSNISTYTHSHDSIVDQGQGSTSALLPSVISLGIIFADNITSTGTTSGSGSHNHTATFSNDGTHTHTVNGGGDAETRPYTIGVVWAVRVRK